MEEKTCIWRRLCFNGQPSYWTRTLATAICWNIWLERNNRIFNFTAYSFHICIQLIMHDFTIWTCIPSDKERVQISGGSSEDDLDSLGHTWSAVSFLQFGENICLATLGERHVTPFLMYFFSFIYVSVNVIWKSLTRVIELFNSYIDLLSSC